MKRAFYLLATVALLAGCAPQVISYQPTPCKRDYDARRREGVAVNVAYELYIDCIVAVAEGQVDNGND